jgi:hypothetical protein
MATITFGAGATGGGAALRAADIILPLAVRTAWIVTIDLTSATSRSFVFICASFRPS